MPHDVIKRIRASFYKFFIRLKLILPGKVMYIGGSDTLPPPLTREEEAELLRRLDQGETDVRQILIHLLKNTSQRTEVSLDEPLNTDWDGNELLLSDVLGTDADTVMRPIEADVERQLLDAAIAKLSQREQEIIVLRFGLRGNREQTQKEVADRLGISQSYISRLEKRIISRLKRDILRMS